MKPSLVRSRASTAGRAGCVAPDAALLSLCGRTTLLAVLLVGGACGGDTAPTEAADNEQLLVVSVIQAELASGFQVFKEYQGQIEPRRRSRLGFDLAGVLQSVAVDEGSTVANGGVLASLDTQRLAVRQRQVSAALDEATTAFGLAESTFSRFEQALERKAVSPQDVDEARRRRDGAAAAERRAQAELDGVAVDLRKSTLRAPYRGTVTQRLADEGEAIAPGQAILEIIETDRPRVRVGVPLSVALDPSLESKVQFVAGDRTLTARRLADLPEQSGQTRTVDLLFELNEPLLDLRVGQIARLAVQSTQAGDGITLPSSALTESTRGLWSCLVAVPKSEDPSVFRLERRVIEVVEVGSLDGEPVVSVRGAVEPGDLVVMKGLHRLVPGQSVRLATDDAGANS